MQPILAAEIESKIIEISENFKGDATELEAAIGCLLMSRMFGYEMMKTVHSGATYSKYQKILGVEFKDYAPKRTKWSNRSPSIRIADSIKDFWAVADGRIKGARTKQIGACE